MKSTVCWKLSGWRARHPTNTKTAPDLCENGILVREIRTAKIGLEAYYIDLMNGSVSVNPQTGEETVMQGFESVWQAVSSCSGAGMSMDMTGMCSILATVTMVSVSLEKMPISLLVDDHDDQPR